MRSFLQRTPSKAKFSCFFSRKVGSCGVIFEEDQNWTVYMYMNMCANTMLMRRK